MVGFNDPLDDF